MKSKLFYLIISFAIFSTGCKKEPIELPGALVTSKTNLTSAIRINGMQWKLVWGKPEL